MNRRLVTADAESLFLAMMPLVRDFLYAINDNCLCDRDHFIQSIKSFINSRKLVGCVDDEYLNDLWVLSSYVDFLKKYGDLWESIVNQQFSKSWCFLQDCMDLLRMVKKFSLIKIDFFENQLVELEMAYPYNVFFSVGIIVSHFECSICNIDIDSDDCPHVMGGLYAGVMACGVAKNITQVDHVAVVDSPQDKRCVVCCDDNGNEFSVIRSLSSLLSSKAIKISDFRRLEFSKRIISNPEYFNVPRNSLCFCGSGKKFKRCCIEKKLIEGDHVEIVAEPAIFELALI